MKRNRITVDVDTMIQWMVSVLLGIGLGIVLDATWWESIGLIFTFYCFLSFVQTLGREINIKQLIIFIASVQYLLMPVITYAVYNRGNKLGSLWQTFMVVESEVYFSLALPGTLLLWLGLFLHFRKSNSDQVLLDNVSEHLAGREFVGYFLLGTGIVFSLIYKFTPPILHGTLYYFTQLTFVGALYIAFSRVRIKRVILTVVLLILIGQSIMTGMYGELVFWSILGLIILSIRIFSLKGCGKYSLIAFGVIAILLIQSVKHEYRDEVWDVGVRRNDPGLWIGLVIDRISDPSSIVAPERLYKMTVRGNQGQIITRTMKYVPKHEPFARGETIATTIVASLVPRILWPDKPIVGGREKTCRFMGECGKRDYAFNIGQLGEAYVNFGITGGAICMFFYGLLINIILTIVKQKAVHSPALVLWIPLFFYSFLAMETDYLTSLNSFVKGVFFYLLVRYGLLFFFKMKI